MKALKYTIWPILVGILGVFVFFISKDISYDVLLYISSIPIIRHIQLFNMSIMGMDIPFIGSFTIGSVISMLFMEMLTKYDEFEINHCYAKASRTFCIIYFLYLLIFVYVLFTDYDPNLSFVPGMIPHIVFVIILFRGDKFG